MQSESVGKKSAHYDDVKKGKAVYMQIWIVICDYLLLIIAKKQYGLKPSLHTISNFIGQILFKRGDIRDFYNKSDEPVNVPEGDSNRQLSLW